MSLSKLNENLNNHQSLPDQPSLTAQELKILFDKAGNDIKTYINNVLTEEIDTLISNIQSGKIDVNKIINNLTTGGANNVASAETVKQLNNSPSKSCPSRLDIFILTPPMLLPISLNDCDIVLILSIALL